MTVRFMLTKSSLHSRTETKKANHVVKATSIWLEKIMMMRAAMAGVLGVGMVMVSGVAMAQSAAYTAASKQELKAQEKADKQQAKADKAEKKALATKQQKRADKAQDKASRSQMKADEKAVKPLS